MARPYKPATHRLKTVSVQLRPDQIEQIKALAARDDVSDAWIHRDAIDVYLRENTCDTCTPSARTDEERAA